MPYLILILAWTVYFAIHSLMASAFVKDYFSKKLKAKFHFYRLVYNILSIIGLLGLLFLNGSIPAISFFQSNGVVRYFSLMLAAIGVFVIKDAFRQYKLGSFLGFKQEDESFSTNGILNKIRHPIYSGTILIVLGFFLFSPNLPTLISVLCIFVYLAIGINLEEKKLVQKFGDTYLEYKKKVPMLVPRNIFK
ncbi:MAG: isoprenylcysteine carboxylmethyltransferase family protein [Bacteroidia bacterium]|nr:isoprenylcysteine carboxylmethyltransferase family protein [Bacteroidia bacterium]